MKKRLYWATALILLTTIFGTIYVVSQKVLRMDANDPQIQMAEDAAIELDKGSKTGFFGPSDLVNEHVDIGSSLKPFIIVYDKSGNVVDSMAMLNGGNAPDIPFGVLQHATKDHNNIITWQPQPGIRIASVTVATDKYYVLSGRNLREVEKREDTVLKLSVLGWLVSVVVLSGTAWLRPFSKSSKK